MSPGERTVIVLQARMGSTRLPGKVLAELGRWPLVSYCLARLRASGCGDVVLATTALAEDAPLRQLPLETGVHRHAGPALDVLARFAEVADAFPDATYIVRATADNPFVDIDAPARVLAALEDGADHVVEAGLPVGAAVEGIRRTALLEAFREAVQPYDREHVTPWVRRAAHLRQDEPPAPSAVHAPDLRLTVDTPGDLAWARRLVDAIGEGQGDLRLVPLATIIRVARALTAGAVA